MRQLRHCLGRPHALLLGVGVVSSLAVVWELRTLYRPTQSEGPRYLVMRRSLPVGSSIGLADVTTRSVAQSGARPAEETLTDQDLEVLKGATLKEALSHGDYVTWNNIEPGVAVSGLGVRVPPGKRAFVLPLNAKLRVRRGDRVDVICTPREDREFPRVLVEGALVIDMAKTGSSVDVVLALSQTDIETVEKGRQTGTLNLALRNPSEETPKSRKRYPTARTAPNKRVEIWSE